MSACEKSRPAPDKKKIAPRARQKKVAPPKKIALKCSPKEKKDTSPKWCCTSACMALTGPVGERCSIWFEWISLQQGESNLLDCLSAPPVFSPRFNTRTTKSLYRIESTTTSRLPVRRGWLYGRRFEISHPCYYTHRWSKLGETSDEYLRRIDSFRFNVFSTDKGNSVLCLYANAQYN